MFFKLLNNNLIQEETNKRPLISTKVVARSIIYLAILGLFTFSAECSAHISSSYDVSAIRTIPSQKIVLDNDPNQDLEPLPGAKEKLEKIRDYLHSQEIIEASKKSPSINILRGRLLTSLFHLNFEPKISEQNQPSYNYLSSKYPYDPVYEKPFPKRPTLEAIEEILRFANVISENATLLFGEHVRNGLIFH